MDPESDKPLVDFLTEINNALDAFGASFNVGSQVEMPVVLTYGPVEVKATLDVRITPNGWSLINPQKQAEHVLREVAKRYMAETQQSFAGEDSDG